MKKIPTLFERVYENHKIVDILPNVTPGMEWVLNGKGVATVKFDGSCCAIFDGELYKRYDAKNGKPIPDGAIKCESEPDPVTGHLPCWVKCDINNPSDKWFFHAMLNYTHDFTIINNWTYEAIGKHFNGNPYHFNHDILVPHGFNMIKVPRTFDGIKDYLRDNYREGIVFWKDGVPQCKIKRTDFGFDWPIKNKEIKK